MYRVLSYEDKKRLGVRIIYFLIVEKGFYHMMSTEVKSKKRVRPSYIFHKTKFEKKNMINVRGKNLNIPYTEFYISDACKKKKFKETYEKDL